MVNNIINQEEKILEVGGGDNPLHFPHSNIDVTSPNTAKCKQFSIVHYQHDISYKPWPFPDGGFHFVISLYTMEHISWRNFNNVLEEIYRILKPGGELFFTTSNLFMQCKRILDDGVIPDTVEMLFGSQEFPNHAGCHKNGFSPGSIKEILEKIGFRNIVVYHSPRPTIAINNQPIYPSCPTDMAIKAYKPLNTPIKPVEDTKEAEASIQGNIYSSPQNPPVVVPIQQNPSPHAPILVT